MTKTVEILTSRPNKENPFAFTHTNQAGISVKTDGTIAIGGNNLGFSPFLLLLAGLSGCSGIDTVLIFNKKRKNLEDIQIKVSADVVDVDKHSAYENINLDFILVSPDITQEEAIKVVSMSIETYCSVAKALEKGSKINYSVKVQKEPIQKI